MRYSSRHFPTCLRAAILPKRLIRFAEDSGFSLAFCRLVEGSVPKKLRRRSSVVNLAFSAANTALRIVSLGKWQTALLDEVRDNSAKAHGAQPVAPVYELRSRRPTE